MPISFAQELLFISDENEVKSLIIWLEDQKIRHYKIEDRGTLRSGEWPAVIDQVSL